MSVSIFARMVENKIREAQQAGAFDNLPGRGKPLALEDLRMVPEDLRVAYLLLKNARLLPPELELRKEIVSLWELLRVTQDSEDRRAILSDIREKMVHLDMLKRRTLSSRRAAYYARKLVSKFRRAPAERP